MKRQSQTNTKHQLGSSEQAKRTHARHSTTKDVHWDIFPVSVKATSSYNTEQLPGRGYSDRTNRNLSRPADSNTPSKPSKPKIRRVSTIDRLAPRRIRSEKYRRKFHKFKQMTATNSSSQSVASLKTDLALSKLAYEKQAATIRQLQEKLDKAKSRLDSVNTELECPICKELFARPLAIYPCGHIFCEDCLLQTFFTPVPGEDPETTHANRLKQCPDCRAVIHTAPIPVYLVKNVISSLNPEFAKDESRSNGFGLNLGLSTEAGEDPWSVLFPEDLADGMTLTSESDSDERVIRNRGGRIQGAPLDSWDTAVGYLAEPTRTTWELVSGVTPDGSEASGDELELDRGDEVSSTSSDSTARVYNVAPLFSNSSEWHSEPESSDSDIQNGRRTSSMNSEEEEEDPDAMMVEQDLDGFQPRHPNQQYLMAAYQQLHRVPAPIRNCSWITRTWEPPAFISGENEDFMSPQEKTLHQRGIPLDMQDKFQIAYTNRLGLSVQLGLGNVIFLGWNVTIFWAMGDRSGEVFMAYIRWEMRNHPERWNIHVHSDGSWDAHRLRCVNMETGENAYISLEVDLIEGSDTE